MAKKTTKKKTVPTPKKGAWFVPVRGSYLPATAIGWLLYLPYLAYLVFAFVIGWRDINSVGNTILFILPNWIAAAAVMSWIASRKS